MNMLVKSLAIAGLTLGAGALTASASSSTETTIGSAVIRSRTLVAKALLSFSSKPFIEPTKTIPPMMLR